MERVVEVGVVTSRLAIILLVVGQMAVMEVIGVVILLDGLVEILTHTVEVGNITQVVTTGMGVLVNLENLDVVVEVVVAQVLATPIQVGLVESQVEEEVGAVPLLVEMRLDMEVLVAGVK